MKRKPKGKDDKANTKVIIVKHMDKYPTNYSNDLEFIVLTFKPQSMKLLHKIVSFYIRETWLFFSANLDDNNLHNILFNYKLYGLSGTEIIPLLWNNGIPKEKYIVVFPSNLEFNSIETYPVIKLWYLHN